MHVIDLKFSVCISNICPKGIMSQIFDLGPSFFLCQKTGNFLSFFGMQISTFHRMKTRT